MTAPNDQSGISTSDWRRLAGWALIAGAVLGTAGYLAANSLAPGSGDEVYRYHLWPLFEGTALAGDILVVLGLPALLLFAGRARKLHLVGYAGMLIAMVMLNIGEGTTEAFVKPYLVTHGGIPAQGPAGFAVFEGIALVPLLAGVICLGIAVLRARTLPRWIGVAFILSAISGVAGLPGAWSLTSDYVLFAALFTVGSYAVRGRPALGQVSAGPATVTVAG
jgi:hypothetical protein